MSLFWFSRNTHTHTRRPLWVTIHKLRCLRDTSLLWKMFRKEKKKRRERKKKNVSWEVFENVFSRLCCWDGQRIDHPVFYLLFYCSFFISKFWNGLKIPPSRVLHCRLIANIYANANAWINIRILDLLKYPENIFEEKKEKEKTHRYTPKKKC